MTNQKKNDNQKKLFINKETLKHLRPDSTQKDKNSVQAHFTNCRSCYGTGHGTRF